MTIKKMILVVFVIFVSTAHVHANEVRFDGNFWKKCNETTRELFARGVLGGMTLGHDRVLGSMMFEVGNPNYNAKCFEKVSNLHKSLEVGIKKIGAEQIVDGIDEFYSDFRNRSIVIKWAFLVVMQQIDGKPEKDINEYIEYLRKNPD